MTQQWLEFYTLKGTDNKNRTLTDIWTMTYEELETSHDYIQWLFPIPDISQFNPTAPLLNGDVVEAIDKTPLIQEHLLRSFDTMAGFWGLQRINDVEIEKSDAYPHMSKSWCCRANHNHLRITRTLTCLTLVDQQELAQNFCEFLLKSLNESGLSFSEVYATTHWIAAIANSEAIEMSLDDSNNVVNTHPNT